MVSSSTVFKLIVVALVCTMVVTDAAKLFCRKRSIPPFPCLGYLTSGKDASYDPSCTAALAILKSSEQSTPILVKPDCDCWNQAATASIFGFPLYNHTAMANLSKKSNVVFPFKLDGTTNCDSL